jgi:signal recognition particle receptor subunit beta
LAGATLLVFANKQDLPGALCEEEIKDVSLLPRETYIIMWFSDKAISISTDSMLNMPHIMLNFSTIVILVLINV